MIYLVTGGSASGKSEYAEQLLLNIKNADRRYYIATMQAYGEEGQKRIERHKKLRAGKDFITIEQPLRIEMAADLFYNNQCAAIVECVSNLTANEMFSGNMQGDAVSVVSRVVSGLKRLATKTLGIVIVTNNVFEDGVLYEKSTTEYIDALAEINIELAAFADRVIEVTAGNALVWK